MPRAPGENRFASRDKKYGGGSVEDWAAINGFNFPGYIIDRDR